MTHTSFDQLMLFLNNHAKEIGTGVKFADYGGTDPVGADLIKKALATGGITYYASLSLEAGVDLMKPFKGKFDVGMCADVLEHVSNPFLVAGNISNSLKKGALLFVTAPFTWELHYYPADYWRFTPQGLEELFKEQMEKVDIFLVRDLLKGEEVERSRVVGIFRKR